MGGKKKSPDGLRINESEDAALWSSVTSSVKPLKDRNSALRIKPKTKPTAKPKKQGVTRLTSAHVSGPLSTSASTLSPTGSRRAADLVVGDSTGVDRRTAERLRRGKLMIDGRFDLHGHTRDSGERALKAFIRASYERGARCVLIITGKGLGILQAAAPAWLNDADMRPMIVSIQHAQQSDGGTGALYVLLKRRR